MDASSEAEFEKVKCLLDRISWPMTLLGIWPKNLTRSGQLKFTIFITYFTIHLSMQLLDLANVMGNLELVVLNLTESAFQLMAMIRMLIIRLDKTTCRIIDAIEEDLEIKNFRNIEEIRILAQYSSIAVKFYRLGNRFVTVTAVIYYVTPLQSYLIAKMTNGTAILVNPYRIYHFIDLSPIERTAVVYAVQFPMIYTGLFYVTSYSLLLGFVMNLCGQLAVLSRRITTMKNDDADPRIVFRRHTQRHIKIIVTAQWLNDTFHAALLYELLATTVLLGLVVYQFLLVMSDTRKHHIDSEVNIDDANALGVCKLATYILSMIILVYVNCFMGECLNTECNWYEMSPFYKKALIICMETTQEPIRLTAGKFYVFSLEGFTQIMKSSMVYVSLLRTMI